MDDKTLKNILVAVATYTITDSPNRQEFCTNYIRQLETAYGEMIMRVASNERYTRARTHFLNLIMLGQLAFIRGDRIKIYR